MFKVQNGEEEVDVGRRETERDVKGNGVTERERGKKARQPLYQSLDCAADSAAQLFV